MGLHNIRHELSIKSKNGIGFLSSGIIVWTIITIIFLLPLGIYEKNLFMLFSTGLMFPLALFISKVIQADWKSEYSPIGDLGLFINIAQLIYFPILFWAFVKNPGDMVIFFAVITGAHWFPFGWFYHAKAYYVMAPVISVLMVAIGWTLDSANLWLIPFSMVILIIITTIWLYMDYKKKRNGKSR